MKVADLQQFINSLATPMKSVGASEKACNELRQAASLLEPFREKTIAELGVLLKMIDEFQRAGRWPEPAAPAKGAQKSAAKPPKLSVGEAAQKVMALLERITDPDLAYAAIDSELACLGALTKPELLKLAQEVNMTIARSLGKQAILDEIRRRVRDRKGSYERARRPESEMIETQPWQE
jgi:hypothetical protein